MFRGTLIGTWPESRQGFRLGKRPVRSGESGLAGAENWSGVPGLTGERMGYATTDNLSRLASAAIPTNSTRGYRYRTSFDDVMDLPQPEEVLAPYA